MTAYIRALGADDRDAYEAWRRDAWPQRVGARPFEVVESKYLRRPASARCAGSGFYGYVVRGEILGVIGAFAFPLRVDGRFVPGHALVDWAVLPRVRDGVVGGRLLQFGLALPGAKIGVGGGRDSLPALESRARRVSVRLVRSVRDPLRVIAARKLGLLGDLRPAAPADDGAPPDEDVLARLFGAHGGRGVRADSTPEDVLHLARDAHLTGVRVWTTTAPTGAAVVARVGAGTFAALHVLAVRWDGGAGEARAFGRALRERLRTVDAAYVAVHETPETAAAGPLRIPGPRRTTSESWWVFSCAEAPPDAQWRFEGLDSDQLWCG